MSTESETMLHVGTATLNSGKEVDYQASVTRTYSCSIQHHPYSNISVPEKLVDLVSIELDIDQTEPENISPEEASELESIILREV